MSKEEYIQALGLQIRCWMLCDFFMGKQVKLPFVSDALIGTKGLCLLQQLQGCFLQSTMMPILLHLAIFYLNMG